MFYSAADGRVSGPVGAGGACVTCCRTWCPAPVPGGAEAPGRGGRRRPHSAATSGVLRLAWHAVALVGRPPAGSRPTIERNTAATWWLAAEPQMAVDVA